MITAADLLRPVTPLAQWPEGSRLPEDHQRGCHTGMHARVLAALTDDPQHCWEIADVVGIPSRQAAMHLSRLAHQGRAVRVARGAYRRVA